MPYTGVAEWLKSNTVNRYEWIGPWFCTVYEQILVYQGSKSLCFAFSSEFESPIFFRRKKTNSWSPSHVFDCTTVQYIGSWLIHRRCCQVVCFISVICFINSDTIFKLSLSTLCSVNLKIFISCHIFINLFWLTNFLYKSCVEQEKSHWTISNFYLCLINNEY